MLKQPDAEDAKKAQRTQKIQKKLNGSNQGALFMRADCYRF